MDDSQSSVVPMLAYMDGPRAMDWLAQAFGFEERQRWLNERGELTHGEMSTGGWTHHAGNADARLRESASTSFWLLPRPPPWGPRSPWVIDGVLVYVEDITSHFDRARESWRDAPVWHRDWPRRQPSVSRRGPRGTPVDVHGAASDDDPRGPSLASPDVRKARPISGGPRDPGPRRRHLTEASSVRSRSCISQAWSSTW